MKSQTRAVSAASNTTRYAAAVADRLRGGGLRFLVPDLAVNDRRVAALGVAPDVLPDVQHRAARRVDERAAARVEALQHRDGDAERRQDHDVVLAEASIAVAVVAQERDPHGPQLLVHVRVVDDFAGEEHAAVGKALARLIRVVDGAIDAVAEAELAREMDGEAAGL